jgi:Fur family ferric uptake transcriptional regulator
MERQTRQRAAIRTAIAAAGRPLSPAEVLAAARREVPGLGMATVYRTLGALLEEGAVVAVDLPGAAPRYEPADLTHHHHFRCRACDRVYEVPGCARGIAALAPAGFEVDGHELVLYGRCGACVTPPAVTAPAAEAAAQWKSAGAPVAASPSATSAPRTASSRREPARRSRGTSSDAAM